MLTSRFFGLPTLLALALAFALPGAALAQSGDTLVVEAREAARKGDKAQLALLRSLLEKEQHALTPWADYWDLGARLSELEQADLERFYARWPGSYVEDRLRNDWLLELGKRRDWANLRREFPRFRMNDDREVTCYALLARHLDGASVREAALPAWTAQRDLDDGCHLMASTLAQDGRLPAAEIWRKVRLSVEANRPAAARAAARLVSAQAEKAVADVLGNPASYLAKRARAGAGAPSELAALALLRMAASDPAAAATQADSWETRLPADLAARVWAGIGRESAQQLDTQAAVYYRRALRLADAPADWPDETLAWGVRAALRASLPADERWDLVRRAIDAMRPAEQADPAWVYWRARARQALAPAGPAGDAEREQARQALDALSGQLHFYGQLAAADLGRRIALAPAPALLTDAERAAVRRLPGLQRALQLIGLGLRSEGVREWNFTLRDLQGDRQLLAAAEWACEREVWDRCINTSDRTRDEVDLAQRFPMPFRQDVVARAGAIGLDPAYVYGLIRQESRFIMDARSVVGASGLMQLMPATARWTAKKIGLDFKPSMITDRDVNIRLGTSYLKLALDDFEGSEALAAAAYNAGPGRPRRWREGPPLETAAWAENIPFSETRDYVKKVLSNAAVYAALIGNEAISLKSRLGGPIGPRAAAAPESSRDLP